MNPFDSTPGQLTSLSHHDVAALDDAALARLSELDPDGSNGLVERVLSTYAASLDRLMAELRAARVAGQSDVVRRVAHTLKSSSASVGATVFASLCAQVEAATREPQPGTVEPLLDALEAETVRVRRAVHVRLAA